MMRFQRNVLAFCVAGLLSSPLYAQGFALNEQSIVSMGSAHAGRAALAQDASVIYTNPAALAQLKQRQFTGNATFIKAYTDINAESAKTATGQDIQSPPTTNDGDIVPNVEIASSFLALPMHDKVEGLAVGVGLYAPYGLATNYEESFQGLMFGDKSKVKVITLQPTAAYQVNPTLSIGGGLMINRAEGELTSGAVATPVGTLGTQQLKGDDIGYGFQVGALFAATPELTLGFNYKSKVDYSLEGDIKVKDIPNPSGTARISGQTSASLDISTPESIELSAKYQLTPELTLLADLTHTRWSRIQTLHPNYQFSASQLQVATPQGTVPLSALPAATQTATLAGLNGGGIEELGFENTNMYSVGMHYQYQPNLVLRAGIGVDESPVSIEHRNVRLPTADRTMFSVGVGYTLNPQISMDAGYMYFFEDDAKIDRVEAGTGSYRATYQNSAHILGAQLNYRF